MIYRSIINKVCFYSFNKKTIFSNKVLRNNQFYNISIKNFAIPLSFKNKINNFYKYVHPDVLGSTCPEDYRKNNEKSVQDLNSYMDCLDKGSKFDAKNLTFYIKIEHKKNKKEEITIIFQKLEIMLEEIKSQTSQSNRVTLQLKYFKYNY